MAYDSSNIFARIIRGELPCDKVYEDDRILAFRDISPLAPVHILVIPKESYVSMDDFTAKAPAETVAHFFKTVGDIAREQGVDKGGYRLIANHGADANQEVPHFHFHIIGGKYLGAMMPRPK